MEPMHVQDLGKQYVRCLSTIQLTDRSVSNMLDSLKHYMEAIHDFESVRLNLKEQREIGSQFEEAIRTLVAIQQISLKKAKRYVELFGESAKVEDLDLSKEIKNYKTIKKNIRALEKLETLPIKGSHSFTLANDLQQLIRYFEEKERILKIPITKINQSSSPWLRIQNKRRKHKALR